MRKFLEWPYLRVLEGSYHPFLLEECPIADILEFRLLYGYNQGVFSGVCMFNTRAFTSLLIPKLLETLSSY